MSAEVDSPPAVEQLSHKDSFGLLFQQVNFENFLAVNCQCLIGFQLLTMDFDLHVHQTGFILWKLARQHFTIFNTEYGMDVRHMVLLIVRVIHANDDAVEHGYDGRIINSLDI